LGAYFAFYIWRFLLFFELLLTTHCLLAFLFDYRKQKLVLLIKLRGNSFVQLNPFSMILCALVVLVGSISLRLDDTVMLMLLFMLTSEELSMFCC
jgi:hypothetical protein